MPLLTAILALAALSAPAAAGDQNTFVIPAAEGYGVGECLSGEQACGKAAADAWCDAHGLGPSLAFGLASDMTGSIGGAGAKVDPDALVISCAP